MAAVTLRGRDYRSQEPYLLDLDADGALQVWTRVIAGVLLIVAFAALVGLWIQPWIRPDESGQSHLSPSIMTMPALFTSIPEASSASAPDFGPAAADIQHQLSIEIEWMSSTMYAAITDAPLDRTITGKTQDSIA